MIILITGGAGFIGSNLVRQILDEMSPHVVNLNKLIYTESLTSLHGYPDYGSNTFVQADLRATRACVNLRQSPAGCGDAPNRGKLCGPLDQWHRHPADIP
ncbi:MAG: GDP-mannose 4,6-dehydratase [Luteolibacter sp.]